MYTLKDRWIGGIGMEKLLWVKIQDVANVKAGWHATRPFLKLRSYLGAYFNHCP
jgi:hypothetical protein